MFVRVVLAMLFAVVSLAVPAPAEAGARCAAHRLEVAPKPGSARSWEVAVRLCLPAGEPTGVDVLVHGSTYNGTYWDWGLEPEKYSYVRKTLSAGRAALSYDRPGTGASGRPAAAEVTVAADAHVLRQVVLWAADKGFGAVTVIGHSLGSSIAMKAAAGFSGIDRLVLTGMVHPGPFGSASLGIVANLHPASRDPRFAGLGYGPGYVTSRPGTRAAPFFHAPTTDPRVIAHDEAVKDASSLIELLDAVAGMAVPPALNHTRLIEAPVLFVVGAKDAAVCGPLTPCTDAAALRARERPYFPAAASLDAALVGDTGHDLTLHTTADNSFKTIDTWIREHPFPAAAAP